MSDISRNIRRVEIRSQTRQMVARERWHDAASLRMYGESPGVTALQIRGTLATPSSPPAYAHAYLGDEDLVWLMDACAARLKDRGLTRAKIAELRMHLVAKVGE